MTTTYSYTSYENINNVSSYIYSSYINEDLLTTYYSYTYAQIINIDKSMTYNSYISYNIDIATINFNVGYLNNLDKKTLDNNLLVVSIFDNKMLYNKNIDIPDYQKNGILFINNERNIIPLNQNIKNINSALTLENGEIKVKIDSNTIKDVNEKLIVDNSKLRLANNDIPGLFKVDNESLIIEDNAITISYNIQDIINNIDDHISIMTNIINQTNNNLEEVMKTFKENVLYDKKYSCNTNTKYPIYYSNDIRNNILMERVEEENNIIYEYYVKYWQKFFKLKVKFVYNYLSSTLSNFNPFNEKYLNITIFCDNEDVKKCIKFNINKSYIYDNNVTYFDEHTNNVYGEINYICYFDIDNDLLYKIQNLENNYKININIEYNDTFIKMKSFINARLILFIDINRNDILNKIIYHNYDVGFNYDGIGNRVGVCMIRKDKSINNTIIKPIFLKYFENESNIIENNISLNIFENIINDQNNINDNKKLTIYTNQPNYNIDHIENTTDEPQHYNSKYFYYKGQNLDNINGNLQTILNNLKNTKLQYKKYLKSCFNNTYNIHGNGLRHGDCYVPSIEELAIFYKLGFNNYNNYKDIMADCDYIDTQYGSGNLSYVNILTSSTLYKKYDKTYLLNYLYRYNYTRNMTTIYPYQMEIPTTLIDENNQYKIMNESTGNDIRDFLKHKSISLFKLPDFSILNGNEYNLSYDEEIGYEVIDYSSKSNIKLKVKYNNDNIGSISETFKIYCSDLSVEFSKISYNEIENNIYEISFTIKKYNHFYNNIDIYYIDSDSSLNTNILNIDNTNVECRILCRVSIKID